MNCVAITDTLYFNTFKLNNRQKFSKLNTCMIHHMIDNSYCLDSPPQCTTINGKSIAIASNQVIAKENVYAGWYIYVYVTAGHYC